MSHKAPWNTRQNLGALVFTLIAAFFGLAGCAALLSDSTSDGAIATQMKSSFSERGPAKLDRVVQNELQQACTEHARGVLPQALRETLERAALAAILYPSDGKWLGEFVEGEKIAQLGRGLQFSDPVGAAGGGNCYACHQMTQSELSYGNIGPSLYHYGKLRGNSDAMLKYTWGKIWNSHAYNACSQMPRYGEAKILTEQQIKHLMALLLDPASPVNR